MTRILVTGGCGFIGTEVVKQLLAKGHQVIVADNLSKPESKVKEGYTFKKVDLTDKQATSEAFKDIDICVNLASKIGGIGYFHKYPATIISENNKIYSNTFEAAVKHNIKRMIYISSSMVYESTDRFPSKESDITSIPPPISSYGFSKLCGEWYCNAFHDEYSLPFSICRPFNAYGINEFPGQEIGFAHVIPDIIKKCLAGQYPIEMLGDGQQSRCFTHVTDLASGIITVMEHPKALNQDFNISTKEEIKMIDLARKIFAICNPDKEFKVKFVPAFKHDVQRRIPDTSKMRQLLGWEAKISLEKGLPEVVNWLKDAIKNKAA